MIQGPIYWVGSAGAHPPPPPPDDLQLSNTTGILVFAFKICLRHQSDTPFPSLEKPWTTPVIDVQLVLGHHSKALLNNSQD